MLAYDTLSDETTVVADGKDTHSEHCSGETPLDMVHISLHL